MGLPHLPSELLAMIAGYITPYDFECHSRARKRMNGLGHLFHDTMSTAGVIADDPIIATYMVHVKLDDREYCEETDLDDADYVERMTKRLAPSVLGSPHLSMLCDDFDEPAELWLQQIVRDLEYDKREIPFAEFGVPFLFTLLINVETLTLPEEWCDHCIITNRDSGHIVTSLLRLLVTRANDKTLKEQPLQKLRAILPSPYVDLRTGTRMEQLFPFLSLDSLTELHHMLGICSFARGITAFPTLGRNLEIMKLKNYDIWEHSAKVLFKDMHVLRVLEMEYSTRDHFLGRAFQADLFMRSVITGTFGSLEKLVFTGRELWPDTGVLECSLREFTRLRHLELSTIFLVNGVGSMSPEDAEEFFEKRYRGEISEDKENIKDEEDIENEYITEDDELSVDEEETSDEEDDEYVNAHKAKDARPGFRRVKPLLGNQFHPDDKRKMYRSGKRVWRLVSVLPESLESLIIHTPAAPRNSACVERMFWRFEELRAQRLPNLKQIELHVYTRYPSSQKINGYLRQTRRLTNFFADKMILTKFEKW